MTQQPADTSVRASVVVEAPRERAFVLFTEGIGTWWDPAHHVADAPTAQMVFEPRVGGHVIDRGTDGSECRWARVLAYEPPARFVISWDLTARFTLETDPARTSEIEVRFTPQTPDRTLVELEHRHLERHGDGWQEHAAAVGSDGGWPAGLRRFAAVAAGAPA